jgi:hypothetical protein
MTTPDHDESKPRRRWPTYLAVVLVLVLVVYPLSYGPAVVIAIRYPGSGQYYLRAYRPLIWLSWRTGGQFMLASYKDWWMRMTDTEI